MLVEGWLSRAASARPNATALETTRGSWSYAQLHGAARAGAAQLAGAGAGRGSRVAIALPAGLELAQAIHACLLAGAVAVPVDLRLSPAERDVICAGAQVLIDEPLDSARATEGVPAPSRHELDATAVVIHTSGTTAQPRPIELTYGNFLWSALGSAVALGLDPNERWLCALPLSHVGGLSILLRSAIYTTTAVVHERFEEDRVLNALNAEGVTLVSLVATTLTRLLDAGLERPPALRSALTGGGPVPAALVQRAHAAGVPVSLTYGLTESCSQATTTPVAASSPEGEVGETPTTAGPPLFCTRVRIAGNDADADGLTEHAAALADAPGGQGEILISGPTVAPGSLAADGWLHTGDLGELDERERLRVTGRMSDTIVSGGENVAPAEVEAVLEAHPQVLEAAVLGRADPQWGEAVTAIVVAREGAQLDVEELRAHCAVTLAPYKVPKRVSLSSAPLPRTRSGKLLRRELR
jgi:O-succinylbenzoic acid--CoA ligase